MTNIPALTDQDAINDAGRRALAEHLARVEPAETFGAALDAAIAREVERETAGLCVKCLGTGRLYPGGGTVAACDRCQS